ncbi:MAG: hypothetical protein RIF32_09360 [Leptospirales bacterium]|jgi:hypothetical protein
MKPTLRRRVISRIGRMFGLHPDVSGLIAGALKLANPKSAALPLENVPLVSRVIASGLWNYSFFQFYPQFARPYWAHRQYDIADPAYLPRAGSPLSVNLTHRTWMGVRGPDGSTFGVVDPAGSLSPVVGYYSIELGVLERTPEGDRISLATRRDLKVKQSNVRGVPVPRTEYRLGDRFRARWTVSGSSENPEIILSSLRYEYTGPHPAWIVLGVRPFNQEGPALIGEMEYMPAGEYPGGVLQLNGLREINFITAPDRVLLSDLEGGDAYFSGQRANRVECPAGICTAALHFGLGPSVSGESAAKTKGEIAFNRKGEIAFLARSYEREVLSGADEDLIRVLLTSSGQMQAPRGEKIRKNLKKLSKIGIPGKKKKTKRIKNLHTEAIFDPQRRVILKTGTASAGIARSVRKWDSLMERGARFKCARGSWNNAARNFQGHLVSLQTGTTITPGVYTYRLFWFRDAAYMLSALVAWNYIEEAERVIQTYKHRVDRKGFFRSQEGEWDSNGQALWTLEYYVRHTGNRKFLADIFPAMLKGAQWIHNKRREGYRGKLLPAGFSAEHLGPADYYYWDNLWSLGGLEKTVAAARVLGDTKASALLAEGLEYYRKDFLSCSAPDRERLGYLPAAPGRELDGGAIGGLPLLYPLELNLLPREEVRATIFAIYDNFFPEGLFLQPVIHSGYNVYLSIQVAQCMLRLGEIDKARRILKDVLRRRTDLWTYPEAIHPRTGGGVMGDGYHGWAFAEILLLLREFAVRREGPVLHIFRGLRARELFDVDLEFGPFPLDGAKIQIRGRMNAKQGVLQIQAADFAATEISHLEIYVPGAISAETLLRARVTGGRLIATEGHVLRLEVDGGAERFEILYG